MMERLKDKKRECEKIDSRIDNPMRKIMYQAHYQNGVQKVNVPSSHQSWSNFVRPEEARRLSTPATKVETSKLWHNVDRKNFY